MMAHGGGHIVNITASIALQPLGAVTAALPILVKGGLNQATKALALELAPHNIKVSAVAPGIVDTPLYTKSMHDFLKTLQPLGRIGTTQEIRGRSALLDGLGVHDGRGAPRLTAA